MASADWKVLADLVGHVLDQGGQVSSEKFQGFYSKHPAYKAVIKNMRTFCEQHGDVFAISDNKPHWLLTVKLPTEAEVAKQLASHVVQLGGAAALADLEVWKQRNPAMAKTVHKGGRSMKDFFDTCAKKFFTVESTSGIVTKVSSKASKAAAVVCDDRACAAASLALYIQVKGGSVLACNIHEFYAQFPQHKQAIGKLKNFCEEQSGLLLYENVPHPGKISLPKYCCPYLLNACSHESGHNGYLHSLPPSGAVHCGRGSKCTAGHWDQILLQARPPENGTGTRPAQKSPMPRQEALEPSDASVAASLAIHVRRKGGSISGSTIAEYYQAHPSHKSVISQAGLRTFCDRYDGLFLFDTGEGSGTLSLRSYCCHFLRGECVHGSSHDGKLHSMPSAPFLCSFGPNCNKGHWSQLEQLASQPPPVSSSGKKLAVEDIRWTHDAIRTSFRDGRLLMETLAELLQGKLQASELPMPEVLELHGSFYAIEGNRRLWVLKEFQHITGQALTIEVKRRADVKGFAQSFTSKNGGQCVEFYIKSRERTYPSMGFALAVIFGRPPSEVEMAVGRELAKAPGSKATWETLEASLAGSLAAQAVGLEPQLRERPFLFRLTAGRVSLADSMTAFGVLTSATSKGRPAEDAACTEAAESPRMMYHDRGLDAAARQQVEDRLREAIQAREGYAPLSELETADLSQETLLSLVAQSSEFRVASVKSSYLVSLADGPERDRDPQRVDISDGKDSESPGPTAELTEVLRQAGGTMPLTDLEWTEVCMENFSSLHDMTSFLESQPESFSLRWEGAQRVVTAVVSCEDLSLPLDCWDPQGLRGSHAARDELVRRSLDLLHGRILMFATVGRVSPWIVCKLAIWRAAALRPTAGACQAPILGGLPRREPEPSLAADPAGPGMRAVPKEDLAAAGRHPPGLEALAVPPAIHGRWGKLAAKPDAASRGHAQGLRGLDQLFSLLPSAVTSMEPARFAELLRGSEAQRLVLQVGEPMKVAQRSGWLEQPRLPSAPVSQEELEVLAARLGLQATEDVPVCLVPVIGTLHRVSFGVSAASKLCLATIHIGRSLRITSPRARQALEAGSVAFLGPASSGKTTVLRAVAAALAAREQVLIVDFRAEIVGVAADKREMGLEHAGYLVPQPGYQEDEVILRAIEEHAPEVLVAEFSAPAAALSAARHCAEAGVRLLCSLRCTLQALVVGEGPVCEGFPFASLVVLSRKELGSWRMYREAAAAVCSLAPGRMAQCGMHPTQSGNCTPEILVQTMA